MLPPVSESTSLGTIETRIPARLDRLPWSRFHRMVVISLGTVWILDGLEVTIVGSIAAQLLEKDRRLTVTASPVLTAGSIYVAGACVGALITGQLTDRFGRRKLFLLTLVLYLVATVATTFAGSALYSYIARFCAREPALAVHPRARRGGRADRLQHRGRRALGDGEELEEPDRSISVNQRKTITFRTIASTACKEYPRRAKRRELAARRISWKRPV